MITQELIDRAGGRFMPDGLGGGCYVRDLPSWRHQDFRVMVCGFLDMESDDIEDRLKRAHEEEQRQALKERIGMIPEIYRQSPKRGYADSAWDAAREFVRAARMCAMKGQSMPWLYITAKSGRGKSLMAGQVSSALAQHVSICWINCQELDAAIKSAAGGDKVAESFKSDKINEAAHSVVVVLDDFGKPDTVSDGVSLPHRIQPIHGIIEAARTGDPRRSIVITSEYDPQALERRVSAGVVNRIMELSSHVVIEEPQKYIDWSKK